jgi:glucokinase
VVDKRIYHGVIPGEAEIGHVRLDKTGVIVEERCAGWSVDKRIRTELAKGTQSNLRDLIGTTRGAEARHLAPALARGDTLAREILADVCDDLAFGLSHVVHLTHPQMIVLGGGLSLIGEPLQTGVQSALLRYTMHAFHPGPQISIASLGEDVVPIGALLLARGA